MEVSKNIALKTVIAAEDITVLAAIAERIPIDIQHSIIRDVHIVDMKEISLFQVNAQHAGW